MSATLDGKRALVTGGSKGIGRSIALALAEAGATVVVSARHMDELEAVVETIGENGGRALAYTCDVADVEQVESLRQAVFDELGGLDILVNNAGMAGSHKFITHPDNLWHQTLAVNLTGVFYLCRAFAAGMVEQEWGRIVNVASIASKVGARYVAAYTASKHGVLGLTRSLAVELTPHVTVNAICPGYVDTPMTNNAIDNIVSQTGRTPEEALAILVKGNPQGRLIDPDEVAAVALLLCQESGRGITGQAVNVDGGAVMF